MVLKVLLMAFDLVGVKCCKYIVDGNTGELKTSSYYLILR